jgi:hypothetical protein
MVRAEGEGQMDRTASTRQVQADLADLAAIIERAAADVALSEEPAGFQRALENGARDE